ncbi:MAG: ROK family protein [Gammaproteobacteria bacterium]|jgi:fructokinase|nr:ROK family protein [Gammaproteobacteria bacterium]
MRLAGIEAGGTKFICVMGDETGKIIDRAEFPTQTPEVTLAQVIAFMAEHHAQGKLDAIGVGCFGPIDPLRGSKTYGYITSTPKMAWQNCDIVGQLQAAFPAVSIGFDTDVNVALLGEMRWGHAVGLTDAIYLTVGTGIGGGVLVNGQLLHGVMHSEMGHVLLPHDLVRDPFVGCCPYHHDCLEGLASGPALKARWKVDSAMQLPEHHPAWALEAEYLAAAMMNYLLCFSPQKIILGGGVMKQRHLLDLIHQKTRQLMNGYLKSANMESLERTIVLAKLDQNAGALGSLAFAAQCVHE